MIRRNSLLVAVWAVATMGVTLPFVLPAVSQADGDAAKRDIDTPKLTVDNADLTVQWTDTAPGSTAALAPDVVPVLQVLATNRGKEDATIQYVIQVEGSTPSNRNSRVPVATPTYFRQNSQIIVRAGETKVVPVSPSTALLGGITGRVILSASGRSIVAAPFTVSPIPVTPPNTASPIAAFAGPQKITAPAAPFMPSAVQVVTNLLVTPEQGWDPQPQPASLSLPEAATPTTLLAAFQK